ncbi:MAG: hypothetical protein ACHQEM_06145 [Chitinophagales bacterium]
MERYLIISTHTAEDCKMAVQHFAKYNAGFLTHFEWGCYDNDHHAYAFVDADSHEQALLAVPPLLRPKAQAIKVVQFAPRNMSPDAHKQNV